MKRCQYLALALTTTVFYGSWADTGHAADKADGEARCAINTLSTLKQCVLLRSHDNKSPKSVINTFLHDNIRQKEAINTLPLLVPKSGSQTLPPQLTIPMLRERDPVSGEMTIQTMDLAGKTPMIFRETLKKSVPRSTTTTMDQGFDEETAERLQRLLDGILLQENYRVGVIAQVDMGDKSWRGVGGYARMPAAVRGRYQYHGEREVFTNKYRIGSVTKMFAADLVLQLVRSGQLKLTDTLDQWFPEAPNASEVTIEHLLRQQTGFYDYTQLSEIAASFANTPLRVFTPEELLDKAFQKGSCFQPGRPIGCYSSTNYIVAGLLVEKITQQPLEEVLNRCMLERWLEVEPPEQRLCLRWANTAFPIDASQPQFYTSAYMWHGNNLKNDGTFIDASALWAAGAIVSTIDDVVKAIKTQVKGLFIGDELLQRRLQVIPITSGHGGSLFYYGLGITEVSHHDDYFGHCGGIRGYQNCVFYHAGKDIAVAVNFNVFPTYVDAYTYTEALIDIVEKQWDGIMPTTPITDPHGRTLIEIVSGLREIEITLKQPQKDYCDYCDFR